MLNTTLLLKNMIAYGISPDTKFTDVSHFAYMWMNPSNKKLIASHSVYALLELEPYSVFLTEHEYRKYVHPDDLFKLMRAEEKLSLSKKFSSVEYRIITSKEREKYVHHHMQYSVRNGNEVRIISILDDITEQKRADVILEVMNESFFELDENFTFRRVNAQAQLYWHVKQKDLVGKCIWDVFPQAVNTPYHKIITESKLKHTSHVQDVVCPVTGYWLHLSVSPYANGLVIMQYNIQKQKEADKKISELNKSLTIKNRELEFVNSELQTLNYIAANDYQEAFRHLYTNLEFIVTHDARNLSDSGRANIRRAQTAIQKMKLLTDDIVTFSKIHKLDTGIEQVNLSEILKNVLNDMNQKIQEFDAVITADELPVIPGFPLLLTSLFYHLIDNALKFRNKNEQPVITLHYTQCQNPKSIYENEETALYNVISVKDNGIGFSEDEAEKIFDIFYRLHEKNKYRGSGIGLALCKKVMNLHNGFINANGVENNGAEFCCYFPVDN